MAARDISVDQQIEISLVDKFLGDEAIIKLCEEKWSTAKTIKRAIFRGNCLTERSTPALSDFISSNKELSYLSLEWNQIGTPGVISLATTFERSCSLQHIDLKNNSIGDEGAMSLSSVIEKNYNIKTLDLRWNKIGDRGVESLRGVIEKRRSDLCVLLGGNPISTTVSIMLEEWASPLKAQDEQENVNPNSLKKTDQLLFRENDEIREEVKIVETQNSDLIRQLDASALRITDLELSLMREQYKSTKLGEDVHHSLRRLSDQSDEFRKLTDAWERERQEMSSSNRDAVLDMDSRLREVMQERDSYKDKLRRAEEEKSYANEQMLRVGKQADLTREDQQLEISSLTARISEYSISVMLHNCISFIFTVFYNDGFYRMRD